MDSANYFETETEIIKDEEILDVIIRNSKRLMKLEDILNIARIESGSLTLNKEMFNFKEIVLDILSDFKQKIIESKKDIKLVYESNDDNIDIIIEADRNRLCQVISNLLNNSFSFTNEGSITVNVERKKDKTNDNYNDELIVRIKDTEMGISQEMLPNLFTKFATKSSSSGTGLGLFIPRVS